MQCHPRYVPKNVAWLKVNVIKQHYFNFIFPQWPFFLFETVQAVLYRLFFFEVVISGSYILGLLISLYDLRVLYFYCTQEEFNILIKHYYFILCWSWCLVSLVCKYLQCLALYALLLLLLKILKMALQFTAN